MNKLKFYAIYNGQCYIKGYGRKIYKKGIELIDVKDCNGEIVTEKLNMALNKALEKCLDFAAGTEIKFDAILNNNKLSYISNVKEKKEI